MLLFKLFPIRKYRHKKKENEKEKRKPGSETALSSLKKSKGSEASIRADASIFSLFLSAPFMWFKTRKKEH